jgi:N-acetylglucosaminyldiphosphoundecaprenol N-acetyl-beta-D-mannosaminyltransferase
VRPERPRLMGMPLDGLTCDAVVARVLDDLDAGRGGAVLTPNLDVLRQYRRSRRLRAAVDATEVLVADGVPLVWASRLQGAPVPERVTGSDIMEALTAAAASRGRRVFLAGGRDGVAARAAARLEGTHPGLQTDAHACFVGPGPLVPQAADLTEGMVAAAPDLVLVGLPFAAQAELIPAWRARLPATWFVGVGSCFDFVNGDRPRAPRWAQRAGLEWVHRLAYEPRMWRRYLVHGIPFAARLGLHALARRLSFRTAGAE